MFSVVHNANATAKELENSLAKINRLAYQWKMSFNPDPSKLKKFYLVEKQKSIPSSLAFNNNKSDTNSQKHLGVFLDNRLSFKDHLTMILNKVNETIGLLHKLQNILPRSALLTIYKTFIRPHFDYGDII